MTDETDIISTQEELITKLTQIIKDLELAQEETGQQLQDINLKLQTQIDINEKHKKPFEMEMSGKFAIELIETAIAQGKWHVINGALTTFLGLGKDTPTDLMVSDLELRMQDMEREVNVIEIRSETNKDRSLKNEKTGKINRILVIFAISAASGVAIAIQLIGEVIKGFGI